MIFIKKLFQKQAVRYISFGGCTTLVNLVSYALLRYLAGIDITVANFLAISLSILFAYVVNKLFVFESRTSGIQELLLEAGQFIGMRLSTMFIEIFGVVLMCCVWGIPDMVAKLIIQVVVLVLNYVFSKCFVFKEKEEKVLSFKELRRKQRSRRCAVLGFVIPFVTVVVAFAGNRVYPFGDHGVLIIDSLHQYLPFFTEFHEKLVNNDTFLYSMGGGLGFNFWATIAYYLASPMNFLLVLFPKVHMMDAMALFIAVKLGLCGCTFSWYLAYKEQGRSYYPVLFGVMYALSSFMIGYYFNLMWLDSMAMLPLVMLGIERIVKGGSGKLFCVSLFYGLYCNYYIGFMLCLFSCLYLLVMWVSAKEMSFRRFWGSAVTFGWYALLSGGMAAIMLVPAFLGLGVTESAENKFPWPPKFYVKDLSQLTSQFAFVEPVNIADNQYELNAFCGVLTLILMVLFLLDRYVSLRERIAKAALCVLLYLSFDVNFLNFIWHGFHVQNGLPNRFAFIYIAMLLVMGHQALWHLKYLGVPRVILAALIPMGFTGYALWSGLGDRELYVYLITLGLLAVYGMILLLYNLVKKPNRIFRSVIVGVGVLEMVVTGIYGVCMNGTVSRQTYLDDQIAYGKLMERNEPDGGFFRSDIDSTRMRNVDMFMGGDGVMLFSSTMPAATVDLCKAIGMEARTNKTGYVGVTKLFNDVFGVKYVESRTNTDRLYQMKKVDYEEPLSLYRNDNALSIGFMVDSDIKGWDIDSGNHMDVQNQFVALAVNEGPLYSLNQSVEMSDGGSYDIVIPAGMQAYLDVTGRMKKITISTPDYVKSYDNYNDHFYDLGCFSEDQIATVTCEFKENQEGTVRADVYICSDADYEKVHDKLASSQLVTESTDEGSEELYVKDGKIRGIINADQDGTLLFSIPYDTGWTVKVDGEKVETYAVGRSLLSIDLNDGIHTVSLDYTAPGLWEGSILSILCIILFLLTLMLENQRRPVQIPKEEGMEATVPRRLRRRPASYGRRRIERKINDRKAGERIMFTFSEKAEQFDKGIFAVLNDKKEELLKEGKRIYNLSIGTPDFKPAPYIMEAVSEAAKKPENFRYALTDLPELVEALRGFYWTRFGVRVESDEIMSLNGSQEGMAHLAWALCDPGDIVLVPNPGYPIFSIGPALCDAKVVEYPLYPEANFLPRLWEIPEETARKAKLMIISYPLNPVCKAAPDSFYDELIAFAKKYEIMILHDNAYSDIIYDGRKGGSFLAHEGAKDVGIEFYSLSKSYNMTGARVSFALGNKEIIAKFRAVRSQIDYGMFLPIQYGALAALTGPQDSVREQCAEYERRNRALAGGLRSIGWNVPDSEGTMFVWAPLPKGYENSVEFCMELVEKSGVLCTPGSSFGSLGEGYVRFALVEPVEVMEEIVDAVKKSGMIRQL